MHNLKMGVQRFLHKTKGQDIEKRCGEFLIKKNIQIIDTNFYSRFGEIDIIGLDEKTLVFFEVRYRHQESYGSSIESVTYKKQQRIYKTALYFISKHPKFQHCDYRFDIVGACTYNGEIQFNWQKHTFQARAAWI